MGSHPSLFHLASSSLWHPSSIIHVSPSCMIDIIISLYLPSGSIYPSTWHHVILLPETCSGIISFTGMIIYQHGTSSSWHPIFIVSSPSWHPLILLASCHMSIHVSSINMAPSIWHPSSISHDIGILSSYWHLVT